MSFSVVKLYHFPVLSITRVLTVNDETRVAAVIPGRVAVLGPHQHLVVGRALQRGPVMLRLRGEADHRHAAVAVGRDLKEEKEDAIRTGRSKRGNKSKVLAM